MTMMDMNAIINQLDALYTEGKMQEAEAFMEEQLDMAMASGQDGVALGILNEQKKMTKRKILKRGDSWRAVPYFANTTLKKDLKEKSGK